MRSSSPYVRRALATAAPLWGALFLLSCTGARQHTYYQYYYPLEREIAAINEVAYPEGLYTVVAGDTPSSVAARLDVPPNVLYEANAIEAGSTLSVGEVLVVPRPASAPARMGAHGARVDLPGGRSDAPAGRVAIVGESGAVYALSAGRVIGVHRQYPSLGDVVIIETQRQRVVYSGAFTPTVEPGSEVGAGEVIGEGAREGGVTARSFDK